MPRHPAVYIMASTFQHLYIGLTSDIERRVHEHKSRTNPGSFTSRYRLDKLVHVEHFTTMPIAIAREKQLKGWLRSRKLELIISTNPTWRDLSLDWGQPTTLPPIPSSPTPPSS